MTNTKKATIAAQAARQIRSKLKIADLTPESVRSKTYSGGDSITVAFTDASPSTVKLARQTCQPHLMGHFDPMTDSYIHDRHRDPNLPRVYFIHVNNQMSPQMGQQIDAFGQEHFQDYDPNRDRHRLFAGDLPHFWDQHPAKAVTSA